MSEWIPVSERLPEEGECVLIWCSICGVAKIYKGISEEEREAMKRGELPDPLESYWSLSSSWTMHKRSSVYVFGDVCGNNTVPYRWKAHGSPMQWFGQEVTHWMPLPEPPKEATNV
jgi:hypothetical protein